MIGKLKKLKLKVELQSGDTLVEVLLSVTILGLVLVLSFTSASRSLSYGTEAANRNQALAYAREQVELLRSAANNGSISQYPSDGTAFCINPSDGSMTQANSKGFCYLNSEGGFTVSVKYNSSNQTYGVTSQWQGRRTINQVNLYYQVPQSPITTAPLVGVSISASPSKINQGGSTTVTWVTATALSCRAGGDWSGNKPTSGSETISNIQSTSNFSLTCVGLDGVSTVTRSARVYVSPLPAPVIAFKATPGSVASGGSSTLSWSVSGASGCKASGAWNGNRGVSGSQSTGALNSDATYTLICDSNSGGPSAQASVVVSVMSAPGVSISASPSSVEYFQGTTLSWRISGANSCSGSSNTSWGGSIAPANGSAFVDHLSSGTKTFTLACTNASGQKTANATVFVNNNPGFCIDANFQGGCTYFRSNINNLNSYSLNDKVSSVLVPPGRQEILYKDADFKGACFVASSNVGEMSATSVGNDQLSSFKNSTGGGGC